MTPGPAEPDQMARPTAGGWAVALPVASGPQDLASHWLLGLWFQANRLISVGQTSAGLVLLRAWGVPWAG